MENTKYWPEESAGELQSLLSFWAPVSSELTEHFASEFSPCLSKAFNEDKEYGRNGIVEISRIWSRAGYLDFRNKKILDIGCGAPEKNGGEMEPFLARALSSIADKVIGVDISPSFSEPYQHISMDLVTESLEKRLKGEKFDIVIASDFFNSPKLWKRFLSKRESLEEHNARNRDFFRKISGETFNLLLNEGIYLPINLGNLYEGGENDLLAADILRNIGFEVKTKERTYDKGSRFEFTFSVIKKAIKPSK